MMSNAVSDPYSVPFGVEDSWLGPGGSGEPQINTNKPGLLAWTGACVTLVPGTEFLAGLCQRKNNTADFKY